MVMRPEKVPNCSCWAKCVLGRVLKRTLHIRVQYIFFFYFSRKFPRFRLHNAGERWRITSKADHDLVDGAGMHACDLKFFYEIQVRQNWYCSTLDRRLASDIPSLELGIVCFAHGITDWERHRRFVDIVAGELSIGPVWSLISSGNASFPSLHTTHNTQHTTHNIACLWKYFCSATMVR